MPSISLVVCLFRERDFLKRLLSETEGLFDDLIVVHDGTEVIGGSVSNKERPAPLDYAECATGEIKEAGYVESQGRPDRDSIAELVRQYGGRFFAGPRCYQQEPHWPFAWLQAKHEWILRLDADEFPSAPLKEWLGAFRKQPEPTGEIAGYTCVWPLWNGRRAVTEHWPNGRIFLFHKRRVRFIGMVEEVPIPEGVFDPLKLVLRHEPKRRSYGLSNLVFRRQAYNWRRVIAESLLRPPTKLPRWRWSSEIWPQQWTEIQRHPLITALKRPPRVILRQSFEMWRTEGKFSLSAVLGTGLHQLLLCCRFMIYKHRSAHKSSTR